MKISSGKKYLLKLERVFATIKQQEVNARLKNIIFHIDVNSAFLSWEAVYRLAHRGSGLDLRETASAVGGDISKRRGIILAKSIPAKKYGIKTGEMIPEARRKCPGLILVPPNYGLYEKCSAAFLKLLEEYSDVVEQYSIDEAFVDMTASCHLFGTPVEAAEQIKDRIKNELGFTVNIGISENKLLAKMASDFKKPDLIHTLYPEEIQRKMWPLPVSDLFFVGRATVQKLSSMGIRSIGQLAAADPACLRSLLKKQGEIVWGFANGIDFSPVLAEPPVNKGYGNSTTIPYDVADMQTARKVLLSLSETVASRLRADGVQAEEAAVGIRYSDFSYVTHQKRLRAATNLTAEIYEAACGLFADLWNGAPVRHLGIHTARIHRDSFTRQRVLFDETDYEKLAAMDAAVDSIRKRYGRDAVMRAAFLNQPICHMSGGISNALRTH